ncbi:MAG TPA: hypothetical protein VD788_13620, partial [Candidatus Polarisedimenticolaceae bacterium]|nr:hypothetical protein [Candidatus Polarisedimenticolaceae bacterium]
IPVSPPFNSIVGHPNQNKIGDYTQMVSDDTGAALAYAATFNDEQDVWFVRVGDCNDNGVHDSQDVQGGTSEDCDANGHPDECESLTETCDDGIDNDCSGATDCADEACVGQPSCTCDFSGTCDGGEDCFSCPSDCATGALGCGNGVCEANAGEHCLNCPQDCAGLQSGNPNDQFCCGAVGGGNNPVPCTDARCNDQGFVCIKTFIPSCCGDLSCAQDEDPCGCGVDCGAQTGEEARCGDGIDDDCDGASDCDDDECLSVAVTPPDGAPRVEAGRRAAGHYLAWHVAGASSYDVVQGDLGVLRVGGDFATATTACLASGTTDVEIETAADGVDRWYLVRPYFCPGPGSYDTGHSGQSASRDAGIAAAAVCP